MNEIGLHLETNQWQFEPDVMARIRVPAPATDFAEMLEHLSHKAQGEGMQAFVKQEGEWFVVRKRRAYP